MLKITNVLLVLLLILQFSNEIVNFLWFLSFNVLCVMSDTNCKSLAASCVEVLPVLWPTLQSTIFRMNELESS